MEEKIKEIEEENIIILIYFILLLIYLYANSIEINYLNNGNEEDKDKYRILLYIVFGISFLITLYYVINGFKNIEKVNSYKLYELNKLSLIANIMVLVATGIYLYIIYKDKNIDLEISL